MNKITGETHINCFAIYINFLVYLLVFIFAVLFSSCAKNYSFENYYYGSPPSIIRPDSVTDSGSAGVW